MSRDDGQPRSHRQRPQRGSHGKFGDTIQRSLRRRGPPKPDRSEINPVVKFFLFFLNFLFFLLGATMVSLGVYMLLLKEKTVSNWIDFFFDPAVFIMTFMGSFVTLISFCGAFGSLRENTFFLKIYSTLMALFLILEVVAVIGVFIFYFMPKTFADIGFYPDELLKDAIESYRDDPDSQSLIDDIQELFSCCGVSQSAEDGYKDWSDNQYFKCTDDNLSPEACSVPFSCCKIEKGDAINYQCGQGVLRDDAIDVGKKIYVQGCLKGLEVKLKDNIWYIGGVVIGVLLPQAFLICLAKGLVFQIKEQKADW